MPDQLDDVPTWLLWLIASGAVAYALLNLGKLAKALRLHIASRWFAGLLWIAFGPLVTSALRVAVKDAVAEVLAELRPDGNGGHNLRGAIDRMESKLDGHIDHSALDRADLRRWLETIDPGRQSHRPGDGTGGET